MVRAMLMENENRRRTGSRSTSTSTRSTTRRIISITARMSCWNGRARSVFGCSRSRCTIRFSIARKSFVDAAAMGILLIPAAELRLEGADVVVLNVEPNDIVGIRTFADLRALRDAARLGDLLFRAPSFFPAWRLVRRTAAGGNRLLRRDRDLPFSQGLVRPQPPRTHGRADARQAAGRHLRCASAFRFRFALHDASSTGEN